MNTITTTCSGCDRRVVLKLATNEAHVAYKGNGLRGSKHVPGGVGIAELCHDENDLIIWDCPVCDYADSYEED